MPSSRKAARPTELSSFIVSVDSVIFAYMNQAVYIPLIMRAVEPFQDCWSLPGGPILEKETPESACLRKLEEDMGLKVEYLEQLYTFGAPDRDPRKRAFSISYFALIAESEEPLSWGQDSRTAQWFHIDQLPEVGWAFDHQQIVQMAIKRLRAKLSYEPVGLSLLAEEFSLSELKRIYDVILGTELDRRNFQKKLKSTGLLIPTRTVPSPRGKPSQLYRFDEARYQQLKEEGLSFGF
ncbi:NUDIX domain-containing protein [Coraliomargarita sp. SDUM461003]|uniref:NUDIX domain-containing protein n=1 Tax=Thalassobacterium maritimum TaxID=3041265 RepID=A0ABU1AUN9_9BACT|nr:NUDIX domain-containing protein [Coraliomargarita sp. SDUM461003]MDQ8207869.1 NUDIX domain-containing protein [Coraliomargarita sp. SDUM461003]